MKNHKQKKIAVVHDHLGSPGGGERSMLILAEALSADFITAYKDDNTFPELQKKLGDRLIVLTDKELKTRGIRFFWLRRLFGKYGKKLKEYDILIASSQASTEAVARYASPRALKIVYTHTPPRRVFDMYAVSKNAYPFYLKPVYALFARLWKFLYLQAIIKYDLNIANSNNIRKRIKKYVGTDTNAVVWPPISINRFRWISDGDYFLSFGRNDEAKRVELIVEAFTRMPDKKLIICSGGPRLEAVKRIAVGHDNITVLGWVDDDKLSELIGKCRAAIYIPMDEDAGMSHLEANAAGKPYLGVREGGLIESTLENETGILLPANPSVEDIVENIGKMNREWCVGKKEICIKHASRYAEAEFCRKMKNIIDRNNPDIPVIGIDASRWEDPRFPGERVRTGVEVYSMNIIRELIPRALSKKIRVRIYTPRTIQSLPLEFQKILPPGRAWTRKKLNQELKNSPVDYFFTSSYYIPKNAPPKSYAVLHDVIFKSNPERYAFKDRIKQDITARLNIRRSAKLFTVSEASRQDIINYYKVDPEKIIAVPMGFSAESFEHRSDIKKQKNILYIGRIDKKKSVPVLVRAFATFSRNNPEWNLILAGGDGYGADEIKTLILDLDLSGKVVLPGYVREEKKRLLLLESSLFVHPSAHEGSALPLLEAFASGLPAIAADVPAMREVGQDAVLYFKPGDAGDLAEKMRMLILAPEKNHARIERGVDLVKERSWGRSAGIILDGLVN